MESPTNNNQDESNIALIYEYAEQALKSVQADIDALNTKLSAVIGFNAVLIRFSSGLPDQSLKINVKILGVCLSCYSCITLKIISCILLIISIIICLLAFFPKSGGEIVRPRELIEKCLTITEETYRLSIINVWDKNLEKFDFIRSHKSKSLKWAVVGFGIATIISGIDIILAALIQFYNQQ
ncbi:MAG TPA: hypothetical protein VK203_31200 [Nostocaceae cyanobacterium]|nr:hypothetical protein [Nostocaceae cyanobacterium]